VRVGIAAAALALILFWVSPGALHAQQDACDSLREQWLTAFNSLREGVEELRRVKNESVEPLILRNLESAQTTIARGVRNALEARKKRMTEAKDRARQLAAVEQLAFKRWGDCNRGRRWARAGSPPIDPRSVGQERHRLLSALDDLFLDDAYLQYKNSRPSRPSENSGHSGLGYPQ
jgi:hypothetical protein